MLTIAVQLNLLAFHNQAHKPTDKALPIVLHQLARAIGVGKAQRSGAQTIGVIIDNVIPLARQFVNAIDISWVLQMLFVQRQIMGLAILLARTRVDHFNSGVFMPASFQD